MNDTSLGNTSSEFVLYRCCVSRVCVSFESFDVGCNNISLMCVRVYYSASIFATPHAFFMSAKCNKILYGSIVFWLM